MSFNEYQKVLKDDMEVQESERMKKRRREYLKESNDSYDFRMSKTTLARRERKTKSVGERSRDSDRLLWGNLSVMDKAIYKSTIWAVSAKGYMGVKWEQFKEWLFEEEEFEIIIDDEKDQVRFQENVQFRSKSIHELVNERASSNNMIARDMIFNNSLRLSAA